MFKNNAYSNFMALALLFMGSSAYAALIRSLNNLQVIEVSISKHDLTRITVQDDRILNVFGITGDYVLEADEEQGHVFIRPNSSTSLNLTLTTEKGYTQDLRLLPQDQPSKTIVLKEEDRENKAPKTPFIRSEVEELLQACTQNRILLGYKEVPLELNTLHHPYLLIRELRGTKLRGLTFEIKNANSRRMSASEFAKTCGIPLHDIVAILMPTKLIHPGEGGRVHIVAKTNP